MIMAIMLDFFKGQSQGDGGIRIGRVNAVPPTARYSGLMRDD